MKKRVQQFQMLVLFFLPVLDLVFVFFAVFFNEQNCCVQMNGDNT